MIVHIFTADRYHLVPAISEGYLKFHLTNSDKYILFGKKTLNKPLYKELYNKYGFDNFVFCHTLKDLYLILNKHKNDTILFHSGSYIWFLIAIYSHCRNINWVCWGSGASTSKTLKSKIACGLKKYIYSHFKTIVTLMLQDSISIHNDFGIPSDKIFNIGYSFKTKEFYDDILNKLNNLPKVSHNKPVVLIGNNPNNIKYYIQIMQMLSIYKGKIEIRCMLNYSLTKNDIYYQYLQVGENIFGSDFISCEEMYNIEDYYKFMNQCDIYICGAENQSGLGAISTCLLLGKKIYITGKNYQWIKSNNDRTVFKVEDISKLTFKEFILPLSESEINYNRNSVINRAGKSKEKWREYFNLIQEDTYK